MTLPTKVMIAVLFLGSFYHKYYENLEEAYQAILTILIVLQVWYYERYSRKKK